MSRQCARMRYFDLGLLATTDGSPRSTPRPRVRTRALTPRRHASPMPEPAVAPDIHQALDVHRDFPAQIALDPHLLVDDFAKAVDFVVRQVPHARVRIHIRALEELLAGMKSDAKDIGQRRFDALVARKIDPCNSRHVTSPLAPRECEPLTLSLLVPWIHANHPNNALAPDDLALFTTASHRSSYFHVRYLSCRDVETPRARHYRVRNIERTHADSARPWRAPNALF